MGIALRVWIQSSLSLTRWLVALGGVAIGGIVYLAGITVLKVPEIKVVFNTLSDRLKRR